MLVMSAGPTTVSEEKRRLAAMPNQSTDLDPEYIQFQLETEDLISKVAGSSSLSFTMLAEAMLGLEGAMLSFIEPNDRVLVIANGLFGRGFAEMVEMAGGVPVVFEGAPRIGLDAAALAEFLKTDHDFTLATVVHCETPSGIMNPIEEICPILHQYGILTVVDSVSAFGGVPIKADDWKVDVLIGGSQKCLSLPAGLTLITLSERAVERLRHNKAPLKSYYADFRQYLDSAKRGGFPYTMNDGLMRMLRLALEDVRQGGGLQKHRLYAERTRRTLRANGIELYAQSHFSDTVTAFFAPAGLSAEVLLDDLRSEGVILSGGLAELEGKILRIGHMGDNLREEYFVTMWQTLDKVCAAHGVQTAFLEHWQMSFEKK